jgi:hypothetical protein
MTPSEDTGSSVSYLLILIDLIIYAILIWGVDFLWGKNGRKSSLVTSISLLCLLAIEIAVYITYEYYGWNTPLSNFSSTSLNIIVVTVLATRRFITVLKSPAA